MSLRKHRCLASNLELDLISTGIRFWPGTRTLRNSSILRSIVARQNGKALSTASGFEGLVAEAAATNNAVAEVLSSLAFRPCLSVKSGELVATVRVDQIDVLADL